MILRTFIICVFFFGAPCVLYASEHIRVAIADDQKTVTLQSADGLALEGASTGRREKKMIFGAGYAGSRPVRISSAGAFIHMNGKGYRGAIELRKKKNGLLLVVNDLNVEDYLLGVIAAEIPHDWEFEALKAQAVASRTYALYQKRISGKRPYHVLATVNGQMYLGKRGERPNTTSAVRETEGLVLMYGNEIVSAFYHSSCGGHTENAEELWGIDEPYLKGVDCDCQEISKYGQWEKRFGIAKIAEALGRHGYRVRDITNIELGAITPAGRVKTVLIRHAAGATSVSAESLRQALGYSFIPSVFFESELSGKEIVFSGRGLGHGVGMCQWGAKVMARKGSDFKTILSHYYPGTRLAFLDEQ